MAVKLQFRRDTAANWTSNNPALAAGELGLETDTETFKLGDGTTVWTSLGYASGITGMAGVSVSSITRTAGTGAAGTTDTYTITYSDTSTSTFSVYNGSNGIDGTDGAVTLATAQTVTNKTLGISAYTQIVDATIATGTHTFNFANGDMQKLTVTGDVTLAFSNFVAGKVCSMLIDAVNWGAAVITFPDGILFNKGQAPSFTADGVDRLMVIKDKNDVYSLFIVGQQIGVTS